MRWFFVVNRVAEILRPKLTIRVKGFSNDLVLSTSPWRWSDELTNTDGGPLSAHNPLRCTNETRRTLRTGPRISRKVYGFDMPVNF